MVLKFLVRVASIFQAYFTGNCLVLVDIYATLEQAYAASKAVTMFARSYNPFGVDLMQPNQLLRLLGWSSNLWC